MHAHSSLDAQLTRNSGERFAQLAERSFRQENILVMSAPKAGMRECTAHVEITCVRLSVGAIALESVGIGKKWKLYLGAIRELDFHP